MGNRFGITEGDEQALRERDRTCVYCHNPMKTFAEIMARGGSRRDLASIEHLNFDEPFFVKDGLRIEDVVLCCCPCNSSRRDRRLWQWFRSEYCRTRNINVDTVAEPVRKYLLEFPAEIARFVERASWTCAKTCGDSGPREHLVEDHADERLFKALGRLIYSRGYEGKFDEEANVYFDCNAYTYGCRENTINRCRTSES
jgi:hypothetical protein